MTKHGGKNILFAPAAYNLAETSRMVEIAKGIMNHVKAREIFEIQFIAEGGSFEKLIWQKTSYHYATSTFISLFCFSYQLDAII